MNKIYLYLVVAVLLIGGGAGIYLLLSNRNQVSVNQTENPAGTPVVSEKKSLKDLFAAGLAQKCTFNDPEGNGGNVLVADGKMRGDFSTTTAAGPQVSHMVVDGQTSYIWSDGQDMGFKMSFNATDQPDVGDTSPQVRAQGQMDADLQVDVDCAPWVADASVFSLPADVTFSDFSQMILPTISIAADSDTTVSSDLKAQQCAACASVPASAQAQCRTALGCE